MCCANAETERGADRAAPASRRAAMPLPAETLALARAPTRSCSAPPADPATRACRARSGPATACCAAQGARTCSPISGPRFLFPELIGASTLKPEVVEGLDLMILRELTGDVYFGEPRGIETTPRASAKASTPCATREPEIERIAHVGLPRGARAPPEALLGRQGQRAGDHAALARGRDRASAGAIPTSS